jgi:hypothetical protein
LKMDRHDNETDAMKLTDLDAILATEEELVPSSGFLTAVMERVTEEARMPAPIPFPWKRAVPGLVLTAGVFGWGAVELVSLGIPAMKAHPMAMPHVSFAMTLPLEQAGWGGGVRSRRCCWRGELWGGRICCNTRSGNGPVFGFEAVNERESPVMCDKGEVQRQGVGSDHQVFHAKWPAFAFLVGSQLAVSTGGSGVPGKNRCDCKEILCGALQPHRARSL